jgi:chromatin remodeling complex protein RSC6
VAELKGLMKPVNLKADLAEFCGVSKLPRTEITKKLWTYIKSKQLQTKSANGKPDAAARSRVHHKIQPHLRRSQLN